MNLKKTIFSGLAAAVLLAAPANAFTVAEGAPVRAKTAEQSIIARWDESTVQRGDTLSGYCSGFLAAMRVTQITVTQCVAAIGRENGFVGSQFSLLKIGQNVWLPSMENSRIEVAARIGSRGIELNFQQDVEMGFYAQAQRIVALETRAVTVDQVEGLITEQMESFTGLSDEVENRLAALERRGQLTMAAVWSELGSNPQFKNIVLDAVGEDIANVRTDMINLQQGLTEAGVIDVAADGTVTAKSPVANFVGMEVFGFPVWLAMLAGFVVLLSFSVWEFFRTRNIGKSALSADAAIATFTTKADTSDLQKRTAAVEASVADLQDRVGSIEDTLVLVVESADGKRPQGAFPTQMQLNALKPGGQIHQVFRSSATGEEATVVITKVATVDGQPMLHIEGVEDQVNLVGVKAGRLKSLLTHALAAGRIVGVPLEEVVQSDDVDTQAIPFVRRHQPSAPAGHQEDRIEIPVFLRRSVAAE